MVPLFPRRYTLPRVESDEDVGILAVNVDGLRTPPATDIGTRIAEPSPPPVLGNGVSRKGSSSVSDENWSRMTKDVHLKGPEIVLEVFSINACGWAVEKRDFEGRD